LNKFNVVKEGKNIEKEKLYDDNIKLKEKINQLNKEIINLKSEVHKKDSEIIKINKLINEYVGEEKLNFMENNNENNLVLSKMNFIGNSQTNKLYEKSNHHQLIYNLKKQYKELKKQLEDKSTELDFVKKNIKNTKIIELKYENQTYVEEIKNINNKIESYIERLKNFETMQSEYFIILENFKKQSTLINQLREENSLYSEEIRNLEDKLNNQFTKYDIIKEFEYKFNLISFNLILLYILIFFFD
jgi:chromosome segregation ATPase